MRRRRVRRDSPGDTGHLAGDHEILAGGNAQDRRPAVGCNDGVNILWRVLRFGDPDDCQALTDAAPHAMGVFAYADERSSSTRVGSVNREAP